jgi:purine-cytosine permease-like protein
MVITRYSVGFVGGSIFAVLNILTQLGPFTVSLACAHASRLKAILALGFSVTAVILGGQTLTNVSDGKLPLAAAVVLVGIVSLIL